MPESLPSGRIRVLSGPALVTGVEMSWQAAHISLRLTQVENAAACGAGSIPASG